MWKSGGFFFEALRHSSERASPKIQVLARTLKVLDRIKPKAA